MTAVSAVSSTPGSPAVNPALDGLRAAAALGVLVTHVAYQTGATAEGAWGAVLSRLDLAVALFFALSGYLLWSPWAAAAADGRPRPRVLRYLRSRAARVLPAHLLLVVVVLWLLPENSDVSATSWLANLTLTQPFLPLTLAPGLTHLWTLSVEVSFYLLLPVLGAALARAPGTLRRLVLLTLGSASLAWPWLRVALLAETSADLWLPAYLSWFAVGAVLAEVGASSRGAGRLRVARPAGWLLLAALAYGVACTPLAGPELLVEPTALQAATRNALGAVVAAGLLVPLVTGAEHRYAAVLSAPPARVLGRWSYGLFLWHLPILAVVFSVLGLAPFTGHGAVVLLATLVVSVPVAAASYALVEEPVRTFVRAREGSAAAPRTATVTRANT